MIKNYLNFLTIRDFFYKYSIVTLLLAGLVVMAWWFLHDPAKSFTRSIPGMDNRGKNALIKDNIKIGEKYVFFKEAEKIPELKWPRFRGADFDNISKENVRLIEKWGKEGPNILWKITLGEGHAAPAVYDGRIYLLDYIEEQKSDALRCFSLKTGEELWRRSYTVRVKRNHGLSRTIPAVTEKYVVTIGPRCHVMCTDRFKGDFLWGISLVNEYDAEVPFWYTGQCPLIDNDTAIIATGGKALLIGIDCKTGKKAWETPNPKLWKMSHSSIMPMTFKGKKMYVYIAIGGIVGISASGADKGKILWETSEFAPSVIAPSPLVMNNGLIFFTAGYGAGGALMQLQEVNGKFSIEVLQKYKPLEGLASEQQTPVFYNGYVYGILPKDAGNDRNEFVCCLPTDFKKFIMTSSKSERFGLGPYIMADGKFFILDDDGQITIAKASPNGFKVLDKAKIIDGQDAWGPLVITGGYLLMRDSKQMVCLDIRQK